MKPVTTRTSRTHLEHALRIGGEEGLGLYQAQSLLFMGMAYEGENDLEEAIAYYGESLQRAEEQGNREMASFAAISLAKVHLVMGDLEAVKTEIPIARSQAEKLGNTIALLFALTGEAWLGKMTQNPRILRESLQKLRVLNDTRRSGANLRIPERLVTMAHQVKTHNSADRAVKSIRAILEILEALGAPEQAARARAELLENRT